MTTALSLSTPTHDLPMSSSGRWLQVVSHTDPSYGGLSSAVPSLGLKIAQSKRFDVRIAAFCAPNEHYYPVGYDQQNLTFWPAARGPWFKTKQLQDFFSGELRRADGVHIHGLWEQSTAVAARAARSLGKPYVLSAHGMLEPWALANKRLKKLLYAALVERENVARAACVHALTRAEAHQYIRFGARSPIAVIPNGVDIPLTKSAELFLNQFPELNGKRIVLFLARLHPKKGLDLLLDAWTELAKSWPEAHLVVAGPDSEGMRAKLERLTSLRGLRHQVLFTGMLNEPMKWSALASAECFVLPSYSEGLSVGVLEAMGMGLPVIITESCNMPEVQDHQAGWQIKANLHQLTAALHQFLRNTNLRNRELGSNGARFVAARRTWTTIAAQMADVYIWLQGGPVPQTVELVFP
jgi:glycosyltransferase involved in cell wall biosynthesis